MAEPRERRTVRVLIVDDDPLETDTIGRAFRVSSKTQWVFHVDLANTVSEYQKLVVKCHYDVLVVDVNLAAGEEGIDDIILFHHAVSPSTIIVTYTGFPNNIDKVRTCVKAMRSGASDCIEKSTTSPNASRAMVIESVCNELALRENGVSAPSSEWIETHLPMLIHDYGGKAVALLGENVVAEASTVPALRLKLAEFPDPWRAYILLVPQTTGE